jgi:phosphatidylcholine synthase
MRVAAWAVHALTASGGALGLLALAAAAQADARAAFGWLAAALAVDGADGTLARRLRVGERAPQIDGALLDNLVDYVNYVIVPAFLIHRLALLPPVASLAGAACICVASAFQFAHREAKTADLYFRGFPSCWNVVAFYLLLLDLAPAVALGIVLGLCALAFVPIHCVHPSRTPVGRGLTLALGAAWCVALLVLLVRLPAPPRALVLSSLLFPVYYGALSLLLTLRRTRSRPPTGPTPPTQSGR